MSAKRLESKVEENWEILLDYIYFCGIYEMFFWLSDRSASEDLTALSVVPRIFLWEDFQFIKKKKRERKSLELQHNYSSICTNIDHHAHIPQA